MIDDEGADTTITPGYEPLGGGACDPDRHTPHPSTLDDQHGGDQQNCAPRENDTVVATHEISSTLTGGSVPAGTTGVVLKQTGAVPAMYRVRFTTAETPVAPVILDDLTDRDIARVATN